MSTQCNKSKRGSTCRTRGKALNQAGREVQPRTSPQSDFPLVVSFPGSGLSAVLKFPTISAAVEAYAAMIRAAGLSVESLSPQPSALIPSFSGATPQPASSTPVYTFTGVSINHRDGVAIPPRRSTSLKHRAESSLIPQPSSLSKRHASSNANPKPAGRLSSPPGASAPSLKRKTDEAGRPEGPLSDLIRRAMKKRRMP